MRNVEIIHRLFDSLTRDTKGARLNSLAGLNKADRKKAES